MVPSPSISAGCANGVWELGRKAAIGPFTFACPAPAGKWQRPKTSVLAFCSDGVDEATHRTQHLSGEARYNPP